MQVLICLYLLLAGAFSAPTNLRTYNPPVVTIQEFSGNVEGPPLVEKSAHSSEIVTEEFQDIMVRQNTTIAEELSASSEECYEGMLRNVDGSCDFPDISRKFFVVNVPKPPQSRQMLAEVPLPRVDHNILFVHLPDEGVRPEPIVIPPPRQNNIIYVLNKNSQQSQRVIELPAAPHSAPEVYFVNYDEGENPILRDGLDLKTALESALEPKGGILITGNDNKFSDIRNESLTNLPYEENIGSGFNQILPTEFGNGSDEDGGHAINGYEGYGVAI